MNTATPSTVPPAKRAPFRRRFEADGPEGVECRGRIWNQQYRAIFLATGPEATAYYLERLATCPGKLLIWAEKPWTPTLEALRRLEGILESSAHSVRFGEHYLHRPVCERWLWQTPLEGLLGGPITEVEGTLFETPAALSPAMVNSGVLRDLLIHEVSMVCRLFHGEHFEVTDAFAARQNGWPSPVTESYAALRGVIDTGRTRVQVRLRAAKNHPVGRKVLVLHGRQATVRLNLAEESAELIHPGGGCRLLYPLLGARENRERPYAFILRTMIEGRGETLGLNLHEALDVLRILDDAKRLFPNPLPAYERGTLPPGQTD